MYILQVAAFVIVLTFVRLNLKCPSDLDYQKTMAFIIMMAHKFCFVALFACFMCLASISIDSINQQVQTLIPVPQGNLGARIKKWRQDYSCVYQFTEEINRSFGQYLATYLANAFIQYSFVPYELYAERTGSIFLMMRKLFAISSELIYLLLVLYTPNILKHKV